MNELLLAKSEFALQNFHLLATLVDSGHMHENGLAEDDVSDLLTESEINYETLGQF